MNHYFFDSEKLREIAKEKREGYATATPFPHTVIEDFLPPSVLEKVIEEFPPPRKVEGLSFADQNQNKKLAIEDDTKMGDFTRMLMAQFNSSTFVNFLEELTGITGIIPDPHFRGGGLHQTERGGHLGIHADFNYYKRLKIDRRVNVLVYLNKNWKEEYGGHLELWSKDMTSLQKKVLPLFNRVVVFSTTDFSFHGHPEPLTCPEGVTRKSLAFYYYTNGRPANEESEAHTTLFKERPGTQKKMSAKIILKKVIPPIVFDAVRVIRK
jgi:Rps23 Pro-64 3,4-dihydroxylase Tpa1-like proline 4-hydroxylase